MASTASGERTSLSGPGRRAAAGDGRWRRDWADCCMSFPGILLPMRWSCLLLVALLFGGGWRSTARAQAAAPAYSVVVPVLDTSDAQRNDAFAHALAQVLTRVAGGQDLRDKPGYADALQGASAMVQKYQYQRASDGISLQVDFAPAAVQRLVAQLGFASVGARRCCWCRVLTARCSTRRHWKASPRPPPPRASRSSIPRQARRQTWTNWPAPIHRPWRRSTGVITPAWCCWASCAPAARTGPWWRAAASSAGATAARPR